MRQLLDRVLARSCWHGERGELTRHVPIESASRLYPRFHPLTRNERLLISLERIALSLFFTTLLVLQPDNNGLSTVYGWEAGLRHRRGRHCVAAAHLTCPLDPSSRSIISFVVIFSQTQIARATCHNGVAKQCKGCGCCCGLIGQCW